MSVLERNFSAEKKALSASEVAAKDRVPSSQKAAFGLGIVSDHCAIYGVNAFAMPIFNVLLGLSPTLVATALALSRLWDAFTDPYVGAYCDNSKTANGRRKPFLFLGAILTGGFFPFIWFVPESWGQTPTFIYLLGCLLVFFSFYSLFSVPYQSLGMELTASYRERTNVYCWMGYIQQISGIIVPWLLALAMLPIFGSALVGAKWVGAGVGIIIIFTGILPAILCVERYQNVASKQRAETSFSSFKSIANNNPFKFVTATIGLYLLTITISQILDIYVFTYYIYEGDLKDGSWLTAYDGTIKVIFALIGVYIIKALSKKYDKHQLLIACVLTLILVRLGFYLTYNPGEPFLVLLTKPLNSMAETGFWILILSMRADVGDWDEYKSGRRREGMIAAMNNTVAKIAMTIGALLSGVILQYVIGFDRDLGGNQAAGTLDKLLHYYILIPTAALIAIFFLLRNYPLTRKRHTQVRTELEMRREIV